MSFEETLYKVNSDMEERSFAASNRGVAVTDGVPFEETVQIVRTHNNQDGTSQLIFRKNERTMSVNTNRSVTYFNSFWEKTVYISGFKTVNSDNKETWYIRTCRDITDRVDCIANTDRLSEKEKFEFQRSIEKFSSEIQKDLSEKKLELADKHIEETADSEMALYKDAEELNALYETLRPVIPLPFCKVFETAKYRMDKNGSSSEKRNYLKQMAYILDFDWVRDADYREIDIKSLREKISKAHIGHHKQLEEIYTEFAAGNITKIAPQTICLIGHPDTGINQLAETIASSINRGHAIINFSGQHNRESVGLIGSSKVYENGRAGLIFERIVSAGIRGCMVIEDFETYDSEIRNTMTPFIEKTSYIDEFVEVEIPLKDMFVIVTCNDIKDIPMSLRANMTTIYFQDLEEKEIIKNINTIIAPKYCKEYGIKFNKAIPEDSCRKLIYKFANMDMNKLDSVIRSIVVKTVTNGGKKFPDLTCEKLEQFDYSEEDYEKTRNEYVREITGAEHKFFTCFDEYPETIQKKAIKLFEILNWGAEESEKEYARDVIHFISNIFTGKPKRFVSGSVINELNQTHYLQNELGERIEAALLSKELENNTNRMTVIGLKGNAGTGKSSTAMSVAKASGRNCIKINVGGSGGAEIIKGTNKMKHNAGPSMLIKELSKSGHGCYSDVIILDELDKATPEFFNALYEFLDPNEEFIYDQYLECQIPKNNFLVILTFNDISCIPLPIRDRMEVIEYSNYSLQDKKRIVLDYILPKLKDKFSIKNLSMDEDALFLYVNDYDILPGMRNVERDLEYILIRIAKLNGGRFPDAVKIDKTFIQDVLGEKRTVGLNDVPPRSVGKCGMAQALAVTSGGIGVSTAVETVVNPYQEKNVVVTGQLEGSCLESVSLACCYASKYLKKELPKLHIHMTDAIKKDGPSAGITITMSVLSCLLEKPLPNVAFTGAIDLYGNIGPVGGAFEKCIAAERTSVDKVIVPYECYRSLIERKEINRLKVEVVPADTVEDVIAYVWGEKEENV